MLALSVHRRQPAHREPQRRDQVRILHFPDRASTGNAGGGRAPKDVPGVAFRIKRRDKTSWCAHIYIYTSYTSTAPQFLKHSQSKVIQPYAYSSLIQGLCQPTAPPFELVRQRLPRPVHVSPAVHQFTSTSVAVVVYACVCVMVNMGERARGAACSHRTKGHAWEPQAWTSVVVNESCV